MTGKEITSLEVSEAEKVVFDIFVNNCLVESCGNYGLYKNKIESFTLKKNLQSKSRLFVNSIFRILWIT